MPIILKIKSSLSWAFTFVGGIALIILLFIILIILPLTSAQNTYFLSALSYICSAVPFAAFFIFLLRIWIWNTFGKTILSIEPDAMTVRYKNKLFTHPITYLKKEIDHIETKDLTLEKLNKLGFRFHFSLSSATYSVVIIKENKEIRIVDWITEEKADEITGTLKKLWR